MMNPRRIKPRYIVLPLLVLLVFAAPLSAHAAGLLNLGLSEILGSIVNSIALILQTIAGWILRLAGHLVDTMYELNRARLGGGDVTAILASNEFVKVGWSVARDLANLGFVLVLIIIAFSIILRFQTFGSYQLLARLIAAAILVNFSLAIVSPLLALSDVMTNFFLKQYKGKDISVVMAGAFNPQRLVQSGTLNSFSYGNSAETNNLTNAATNASFTVIFTLITALVLFTFAFMLLIRYVYIIVLLVISPLVWLVWLVPGMSVLFKQWWDKFINWTLFMPLVSFFIYIALRGAEAIGQSGGGSGDLLTNGTGVIVVSGLMFGGLMAAQRLGITGASFAIGMATKVKDMAVGKGGLGRRFAGRKGKQYASALFRRPFGKKGESIQERAQNLADRSPAARRLLAGTGVLRGLAEITTRGGENVIKDLKSQYKSKSAAQRQAALASATGARKIALVESLIESKDLTAVEARRFLTEGNEKLFKRFGKGKTIGDVEKAAGMNRAAREALKAGSQPAFQSAMNEFVRGQSKQDVAGMPLKDTFGGKAGKLGLSEMDAQTFAHTLARAIATENAALIPNILQKFDAKTKEKFSQIYTMEMEEELERLASVSRSPEQEQQWSRLANAQESFGKVIANLTVGIAPEESEKKSEEKTEKKEEKKTT